MSDVHPYGSSEHILKFDEEKQIVIENDILNEIFEHEDVRDRKIVIFSVVGAFRKGKSFFLNYCLRYLYAHYPSIKYPNNPVLNSDEWLGEEDEPLLGFSWRSGVERDTTGISLWNDAFLHDDEDTGEEIAIIVMDTQGLFDSETSAANNSRIFAIGTLISSVQVLNISMQLQEDQIQYLQFATDYAKFATSDNLKNAEKCFQNLMFLVRDWNNPGDYVYGIDGGKEYLENYLRIEDRQNEELKLVRQYVHKSFEDLSCALLPHPGKHVAVGPKKGVKYDGNHGKMDDEFKDELSTIIEHLLSEENLVVKRINGEELIGRDVVGYIENYFNVFNSDEIPQTQTVYDMTVERQLNKVVNDCFDEYSQAIYENEDSINMMKHIDILHEMSKNQSLVSYYNAKKMGNSDQRNEFEENLLCKIYNFYNNWGNKQLERVEAKKIEDEKKANEIKTELDKLENEKNEKDSRIKSLNAQIEHERKIQQEIIEDLRVKKAARDEHNRKLRTTGIWVNWNAGQAGVPEHAVIGGRDRGRNLYVIRAVHYHNGDYRGVIPGKYCLSSRKAYIPYYNLEHTKFSFEILTHTNYKWTRNSSGAISGGRDSFGATIYIISAYYDSQDAIGKYHNGKAYIPYGNMEREVSNFEFLTVK